MSKGEVFFGDKTQDSHRSMVTEIPADGRCVRSGGRGHCRSDFDASGHCLCCTGRTEPSGKHQLVI